MNILEYDDIHTEQKNGAGALVRNYLVSNGWKYNSDNPGSIWLWTITREESTQPADDGTTLVTFMRRWSVNESTAVQFQRYWELEAVGFPAHADECRIFETCRWEDCDCMAAEE